MAQILPQNDIAERLGAGLGTGLQSGIQNLLEHKMRLMQQDRDAAVLSQHGIPPQLAYLNPQLLGPILIQQDRQQIAAQEANLYNTLTGRNEGAPNLLTPGSAIKLAKFEEQKKEASQKNLLKQQEINLKKYGPIVSKLQQDGELAVRNLQTLTQLKALNEQHQLTNIGGYATDAGRLFESGLYNLLPPGVKKSEAENILKGFPTLAMGASERNIALNNLIKENQKKLKYDKK